MRLFLVSAGLSQKKKKAMSLHYFPLLLNNLPKITLYPLKKQSTS